MSNKDNETWDGFGRDAEHSADTTSWNAVYGDIDDFIFYENNFFEDDEAFRSSR